METPAHQRRFPRGRAVTAFLRVPWGDWAAVTTGAKTELRWTGANAALPERFHCPEPVVGFTLNPFSRDPMMHMLVIERCWKEHLGSISAESLQREGYDSLDEFRRYWKTRFKRSRRSFAPFAQVIAYRIRPYHSEERRRFADDLFERLWGLYEDNEVPDLL